MAEHEMYDYLSAVTPDTATVLAVRPDRGVVETGEKSQIVRTAEDGVTEERISLSDVTQFYIELDFPRLSPSEAGSVVDMYHSPSLGNGIMRSFVWDHADGHSYVVRFDGPVPREITNYQLRHSVSGVKLKVLGRVND